MYHRGGHGTMDGKGEMFIGLSSIANVDDPDWPSILSLCYLR